MSFTRKRMGGLSGIMRDCLAVDGALPVSGRICMQRNYNLFDSRTLTINRALPLAVTGLE